MPNQGMNALGQLAMPGASMNPLGQMANGMPMPTEPGGMQRFGLRMGIAPDQRLRMNDLMQRMGWSQHGGMPMPGAGQPAVNPGVAPQQAPPPPTFRSWGR
jgi:hypothetical protein